MCGAITVYIQYAGGTYVRVQYIFHSTLLLSQEMYNSSGSSGKHWTGPSKMQDTEKVYIVT